MKTWWLSYAGDDEPRGVIVTEAFSFLEACHLPRILGISPGGQVRGIEVPNDAIKELTEYERNRLYTPEELMEMGAVLKQL